MSTPNQYETDWTDAQWQSLRRLLPDRRWRPGGPGRPLGDVRSILNGILYRTKTGGQWERLPPMLDVGKRCMATSTVGGKKAPWAADSRRAGPARTPAAEPL